MLTTYIVTYYARIKLSMSTLYYYIVNCGDPSPPANGFVGIYPHTREGATVTYQCNDGFVPSDIMISFCTNTSIWTPTPEQHSCISTKGMYVMCRPIP